jgi:hypothetical protein
VVKAIEIWWFVYYIVTEPFVQIKLKVLGVFRSTKDVARNTETNWMGIFILLAVFGSIRRHANVVQFALFFLILTYLQWEWKRGYFRHRMRQRYLKRLEEKKNV